MRFLKFFYQLLFKILHPLEAPFYGLRKKYPIIVIALLIPIYSNGRGLGQPFGPSQKSIGCMDDAQCASGSECWKFCSKNDCSAYSGLVNVTAIIGECIVSSASDSVKQNVCREYCGSSDSVCNSFPSLSSLEPIIIGGSSFKRIQCTPCPSGQRMRKGGCFSPSCATGEYVNLETGKCECPCDAFGDGTHFLQGALVAGNCYQICEIGGEKRGYMHPFTNICTEQCPAGQQIDCRGCVPATNCPGDKEPDPDNPGTCICPAGKSESPPGSDTCVTLTTCLGDKIETPPGSGTCACPDGQEEYPAGSDTCVPECRSDETRDEHGACVCPDGKEPVTVGGNTTCEPMCTNGKIRESGGRGCVCPTGETLQVNGTCGRSPEVDSPVHPEPPPPGPAIPDSISSLLVNTFNVHGEAAYRSVYTIGRADRPDYICWLSKDKDANNKIIKNPQKDVIMRDYTCPHLSKCRQRECECEQLLSNGVWQSIEDTYCEYAYQDPLRLERDGDLPKVLGGVDRAIERNIHVLNVIVVPAH